MEHRDAANEATFDKAAELLGKPLELPLGRGEPDWGDDFRRLATQHTFGDSWSRPGLDTRTNGMFRSFTGGRPEPLSANCATPIACARDERLRV